MLLLGLDVGTSSIKASVIDAQTQQVIASAADPETEAEIIVPQPGWAEQDPESWWKYTQRAVLKCHATGRYNPKEIAAVGIAYQMHGLVLVDEAQQVLRNAIIWCDSRAVDIGSKAFREIGEEKCLDRFLNSPGNFTASKLAWVKAKEPETYRKIAKLMLPGDFISMKLTGAVTTSISALSEGIFWDFQAGEIAKDILTYFGFTKAVFPAIAPLFSVHGELTSAVASELSLKPGTPVAYKAGDQPNNALALHVMQPGEVAATAGTSGVIYGISDQLTYDRGGRINSFAHVNYTEEVKRIGVLLCINGAGSFNRWIKSVAGTDFSYAGLNRQADKVAPGADGLFAIPFGNGTERMLNNKVVGGHFCNLDFNIHTTNHLMRAVQEGIAFSFRYGLDMMRENGITPSVVRASQANLFLSPVFAQAFADVNNVAVELYEGDGSYGAAIGAGIGAGIFKDAEEASQNRKPVGRLEPLHTAAYQTLYQEWKNWLNKICS